MFDWIKRRTEKRHGAKREILTCQTCHQDFKPWTNIEICKECWENDSKKRSLESRLAVKAFLNGSSENMETRKKQKSASENVLSGKEKLFLSEFNNSELPIHSARPQNTKHDIKQLTKAELKFLSDHKIDLNTVFLATGLSRNETIAEMERNGYLLEFGRAKCKKAGHRIRTKTGHCFLCNPVSLQHSKRYRQLNFVYIAASLEKRLTKIGITKAPEERVRGSSLACCSQRHSRWYTYGHGYFGGLA